MRTDRPNDVPARQTELTGTAHAGRQTDIIKLDTKIKRQTIVGDSNRQVDQPVNIRLFGAL
jgi:hypothetical protein